MTHLVKGVTEDKMGYDVELTQADPGTIYPALAAHTYPRLDTFAAGWCWRR